MIFVCRKLMQEVCFLPSTFSPDITLISQGDKRFYRSLLHRISRSHLQVAFKFQARARI
jgi:hypothetical protein